MLGSKWTPSSSTLILLLNKLEKVTCLSFAAKTTTDNVNEFRYNLLCSGELKATNYLHVKIVCENMAFVRVDRHLPNSNFERQKGL